MTSGRAVGGGLINGRRSCRLKSQSLSWMVRNRRALDSFMEMEQNCCLPASLQRKLSCQGEDKLCLFIPTRSPALPETCAPNLSVYNITLLLSTAFTPWATLGWASYVLMSSKVFFFCSFFYYYIYCYICASYTS